jgi:hypothetical protein
MYNLPNAAIPPMPGMWESILDNWWILALFVAAVILAYPKK